MTENEEEEIDEPEDEDLVTEDHTHFYVVNSTRRRPVVTVPEGDDWQPHVRAYMDREQFWSNVWWISDHGNAHPLSLEDP
jgi:hypothetical protein